MNLRDSLQAVYDQRGELTPALVVAEATADDHPLHGSFEWDDMVAGPRYREVQAQQMIRSVDIVYRKAEKNRPEKRTRYWQSVRSETGRAYKPATEVAADPMLTQIVLMDMRREWNAMKDRYGHFAEFAKMVAADIDVAS